MKYVQASDIIIRCRAIARRTARCRCTFRYVSNFSTASCGFSARARSSCWSLQTAENYLSKVTRTRKNQSDRVIDADK